MEIGTDLVGMITHGPWTGYIYTAAKASWPIQKGRYWPSEPIGTPMSS